MVPYIIFTLKNIFRMNILSNFSTPCNVVNIMGNCDHIYSLLSNMIKIRDVPDIKLARYPANGYLALVLGWLPDIWKNPDTGFDIRLDTGYLNKISPRYTKIFSLRNLTEFDNRPDIRPGPAIYLPV